jgi:hypothetical protein
MRKYKKKSVEEQMCDLMCPEPEYEEDKGFEIKCLNCGSNEVTIETDMDYDYEEISYISGYYHYCKNCGQSDR